MGHAVRWLLCGISSTDGFPRSIAAGQCGSTLCDGWWGFAFVVVAQVIADGPRLTNTFVNGKQMPLFGEIEDVPN